MYKLSIELVPETSWCSNVRSEVPRSKWDKIRKKCYAEANNVCEICGGVGKRHQVECHEIWQYDDETNKQTLIGLIALCPSCHQVKHSGLSFIRGLETQVYNQLMKINGIDLPEAQQMINEAFVKYHQRSGFNWDVDITLIDEYIK
jgi:hypothetical protein